MITNVYIDGFNLYYGSLKGTAHKWLNLEAYFDAILPKNTVKTIHYCTAMAEARPNDPDLPMRQAIYLRALATLPRVQIHLGTFMTSCVRAPEVRTDAHGLPVKQNGKPIVKLAQSGKPVMRVVYKSEEKGSDVNLAAHLLRDAYRKECECAVIVSNDSDLLTPIQMVKEDVGMTIGLVLPRPKGSLELKRLANFQKDVRNTHLAAAQFSPTLTDATGTITKPADW